MSNTLKPDIRSHARAQLRAMAASAPDGSALVRETLASWDLAKAAHTILAFLPLPAPAVEVDLAPLLLEWLAGDRRLCLPRIDWLSGSMQPAAISSLDSLSTTRHGVREPPPDAPAVPLDEIDLILVPGLAFDLNGNRLGRGAGFYDRFLAQRPSASRASSPSAPHPPACGVCFEAQIVDRIPTDPWDVPMNAVATERRLVTLPA